MAAARLAVASGGSLGTLSCRASAPKANKNAAAIVPTALPPTGACDHRPDDRRAWELVYLCRAHEGEFSTRTAR
jgi:hypothetical protein